jgi:glycosyltransferase involved in cell wall biosynthesis
MRIVFAIPGDLATASGGYAYDRAVLAQAPALGVVMRYVALPGGFPFPGVDEVAASVTALRAALQPGDVLLIDGLAYGALPVAAISAIDAPILALCHHPLCLETGLSPQATARLFDSEQAALSLADKIFVTSGFTAAELRRLFAVAAEKITVALPGTAPGLRAPRWGDPPVILALGSLIARKGYDVLLEALSGLVELPWRLAVAGSPCAAPVTAAQLFARALQEDLAGRIAFLGEVSAPDARKLLQGADLFVSASFFEGYGMALAEALSFGLPIVAARGGAVEYTLPDDTALKVEPGDVVSLRAALRAVLSDSELAARLAEAAWRAGQQLPDWQETARIIVATARECAQKCPLQNLSGLT